MEDGEPGGVSDRVVPHWLGALRAKGEHTGWKLADVPDLVD
jgi:hypothetical protein